MSDRDILAALIVDSGLDLDRGPYVETWPEDEREYHRRPDWPSFFHRGVAMQEYRRNKLADAFLAAGMRPPAREIADPAELPTGSIVVRDGVAWQLEKGWWSMRGTRTRWDKPHGTGPIILLYVPTEEAGRG